MTPLSTCMFLPCPYPFIYSVAFPPGHPARYSCTCSFSLLLPVLTVWKNAGVLFLHSFCLVDAAEAHIPTTNNTLVHCRQPALGFQPCLVIFSNYYSNLPCSLTLLSAIELDSCFFSTLSVHTPILNSFRPVKRCPLSNFLKGLAPFPFVAKAKPFLTSYVKRNCTEVG